MGQPPVLLLSPRFPLLFRRGRPPGRPEPDLHKIHTLRRGRCPHRPAPPNFLFLSGGRAALTPSPVILCIFCNVSLRASDRRHWCGNSYPCITPPVAPFLSAAKEREERTPSNQGFEILSAAEVPFKSALSATRIGISKFRVLLSYRLCV